MGGFRIRAKEESTEGIKPVDTRELGTAVIRLVSRGFNLSWSP